MKCFLFIVFLWVSFTSVFGQKSWDGGAGTNNWSDGANWLPDGVPANTDNVTIGSGYSVIVDINAECNNLSFNSIGANTSLSLNDGITLTVNGTITFVDPTANSAQTINVNNGSLLCASIVMANCSNGGNETNVVNIQDGTLTVSGDISTNGAANENYLNLIGSGNINIGGNFAGGSFVISGTGSTVSWFGDNTNFRLPTTGNYHHLIIRIPASATANRTRSTTGNTTINGNFTIESLHATYIATLNCAGNNLTVSQNTTINARGEILDNTNGGTNTFTGKITVNANGLLTSTGGNSAFIFTSGIDNYGTFNKSAANAVTLNGAQIINNFASGTFTLNGAITNSQSLVINNAATINLGGAFTTTSGVTLTGNASINFGSTFTIQGTTTVTNQNTNTVSIAGNLTGTDAVNSIWLNDVNTTLNYAGGNAPMVTGVFTANTAPNTVNYNGAAQNVKQGDYYNLTFSTSGTKTLQGITNINNQLLVSGTASVACGTNNLNLYGLVSYTGTGTISSGANTVTYNSTSLQDIIPGTYSGALTLQGSGDKSLRGTTTITGAYTQDANIACGNNNISLNGTVTYNSGLFTVGTNLVTYGSTSAQNIIPATYSALSFTGNNSTKTLIGDILVNGTFTYNCNPGTFSCGNYNLTLSGGVNHTNGTFTTGNNIVTYNGAVTQNLLRGTYSGDLILSGDNKWLTGTTTIMGNFQMGTNVSCFGNNLTLTGNVNYISGAISSTGGTILYNNTNAQNVITGNIGGALTISGGDKTLVTAGTPLIVAGVTTVNTNFSTGTNNITFNGNVTLNGNITAGTGNIIFNGQQTYTSGTFITGANTVTYGGAAAQNIFGGSYGGNLILSGAGAKTIVGTHINVAGDFSMASSLACGTFNLSLDGLVNYTSGTLTTGANIVSYNRSGNQNVIGAVYSGSVSFSGIGSRTLIGDATITNVLNIPNGIVFALNGRTLTTVNNITIDQGGQLDVVSSVTASSTLRLSNTRVLTNNGVFRVIGNATYPALVTQNAAGSYSIVQSAATAQIHASYYQFNYLNNGILITGGGIDAVNNFSNGSFSNGVGNQSLLVQDIDVSLLANINNVVFNSGPTYNVSRTAGTGALNFVDASGVLAGESFDNDNTSPGTLINWNYPATTYYSNPLGTFSAGVITNWTRNQDGSGGSPSSLSDGLATLIVQDGHTVTLDAAGGDINVLELQVGEGTNGTFIIGNTTAQRILTIQQKLTIKNGASISVGSSGSPVHQLRLYGNIENQGTFNLCNTAGRIVNTDFYGTSSAIIGTNVPVFNDITFKTGSVTTTNVGIDTRANFKIENGATFNDGNQNILVKGYWAETGTGQRTGNGTVTFNGTINSINNAAGTAVVFNNVIFTGGGAGSIQENVAINGNLTVSNNTILNINNYSNTILGNFTVDMGSSYIQTANYTYFSGNQPQSINIDGTATFYNITFSNGAANAKTTLGTFTANNLVSILSGSTVDGNANISIAGGIRIDGTCNWSGIINVTGGNIYTNNATNSATLGTAVLNINGNVGLTYGAPATAFQLNLNNNLNIQTGYIVMPLNTSIVGQPGNTLTLDVNTSLYIRGTNNFPNGFGTYTLSPLSYARYDWNIDQTIRGNINYGNLVLNDNGSATTYTKTADGPIEIVNHLYLQGAINMDLVSNSLTLGGNIYNGSNSSIIGPNSTVTLNAPDGPQTIETSGTGSYQFGDLIFTLDAASVTRTKYINAGANISLTGNFSVTNLGGTPSVLHIIELYNNNINGTPVNFNLGSYCQLNTSNTTFGANFIDKFTGTKTLDVNSTVYYTLNGAQSIADGFTYGNIQFYYNNGPGNLKTAEGPLDINGNVWVGGGTPVFNDGGFTHTVAGNWALGMANYTAASATGTIILDGIDQTISSTNFNNLIVSNTGTALQLGTINIFRDITFNNGSNFNGDIFTLNIYGNWITPGTGIFTQTFGGAGVVNFVGSVNQTLQTNMSSSFSNMVINKPNSIGNQSVTLLSDLVVTNNTTITANAGIFDVTGRNVRFGGRLYVYANTVEPGLTFIANNSNVFFDGSVTQNIYNNNTNPLTFNNLEFSGAGAKLFEWGTAPASRNVIVNGNFVINGTSVSGNGWGNGGIDFEVAGDWVNNGTFTHAAARRVTFNGTDQDISTSTFGSVTFTNTNTKTLGGNIILAGGLIISGTATLEPNGFTINLSGDWDNSAAGAIFNSSSGTVIFEGNSSNIITGTAIGPMAGKSFNNVTINKNSGQVAVMAGDMDIRGDFIISSGWHRTQTYDMWVGRNFDNTAGIFDQNSNSSILTLNANGGSLIFNPGANAMSYPLRGFQVNSPGTTYTVQNNFIVSQNQDFVLTEGYFDLEGHTLQLNSNNQRIVINGGTFDVDAGSTITFTGNTQGIVNNGGVFRVVGTQSNIATLTRTAGTYTISQTAGTFHALYYKFDYLNGISISGGSIDATNNFSEGSFSNGAGTYLTLTGLNFTDFTATNTVFNSGPTYNVARTSGTGTITFADASGALSGENYDNDNGNPGTLINWTTPNGYFWDGGAGTDDWNDAQNWSGNLVPDSASKVYLNHQYIALATPYTVRIRSANARANRIILDAQVGGAITLQLENGFDLDLEGNIIINTATTLNIADANSIVNIGGNWSNTGTFNHGNSTIIFDGPAASYSITSGGNAAGKRFYNLRFDAPNAIYALTAATGIDNNFELNAGTFNLASANNDITVGGNWTINAANGAVFNPSTADVTFNGGNQSIFNGPFYNLLTAGTATKTLNSNIAVTGSFTIASGTTFDAQGNNIFVGVNWTNNGSYNHTGLGAIYFNGNGGQAIDNGSSTTTFNFLVFSNGGAKNFSKSNTINGDVNFIQGCGTVDFGTNQITGSGTNTFIVGNNVLLRFRGADNFPVNFSPYNLSNTSTIEYISDIDPQIIRVLPSLIYGNLRLSDATVASANSAKIAQTGNLQIAGSLYINDTRTILDMATNNADMTLTGTISMPTGGLQINWGTGTNKLVHIGVGDWLIDTDITGFNNLELSGSGNKWMQGNLAITGNVVIKNGVALRMYDAWSNPVIPHTMTGLPGKSFLMENGSSLYCPVPAITSAAFATGFGTYSLGSNSLVYLHGTADQSIYTANGIIYGNLDLGGQQRNVSLDGIANLDINGYFNSNYATLLDNSRNISVAGSYAYLSRYTPSSGSVFTMDGNVPQLLYNDNNVDNNPLDLANVVFNGTGVKTIGDGNDVINITGNLTISAQSNVTSNRNINFYGQNWANNGIFQHTGNAITFDRPTDQDINPGPANSSNYFNNIIFSNVNVKNIVTNGIDVNGTFTINAGTVNLGTLSHNIAGTITNTAGGILNSSSANLTLDGGNQNINTPAFSINNLIISGTGTKRLFSNWTIEGNLTINNGTTLNTSDGTNAFNINIRGNWLNSGTFTVNTSLVTFDGNTSPINIASNGSNFYQVVFSPGAAVSYSLQSPITRISRSSNIGTNATLNLNGQTLILGSNTALAKVFDVAGVLNIDANATLKFNNQTSQSVMNVTGNLRVIGNNPLNLATISREVAGVAGSETQINIQSGGTIAARYYLIEYLQDAGLNVMAGSILDPVNNFSDGKWSNIRNANNVCYLNLEATTYIGGVISNVSFDFSGTPVQGQHFNVRRNASTPVITFDAVSGNLGNYLYEDDDEAFVSATSGLLRWPGLTFTNWIGGVSTDWHNPANWDNGVPTATIDAIIPLGNPNQPSVQNSDAVCKALTISTGQLTLQNDYDITALGDISIGTGTGNGIFAVSSSSSEITCGGFWTVGTNGLFIHGNGTVNFVSSAGTATITPRNSSFYNLVINNPQTAFYLVGGNPTTYNIKGSVTVRNGTLTPSTNNYIYNIEGNFIVESGIFNPVSASVTAGTINLTGSGNQNITNLRLYNLNVSGSGTKATHGPIVINNQTTINSVLKAETGSNIDFNGNVNITTMGTFDDGGETHTFSGTSWTGTGTYIGTGTVIFDLTTANQTINSGKFNNLDINCINRTLYLNGNVDVTGDVIVRNGVANLYLSNTVFTPFLLRNTLSAGTFTVEGNTTVYNYGADHFPFGFANYNLASNSIVRYQGTTDQLVAGVNYGILTLASTSLKTLKGDIGIQNTLNFNTSTLDASSNNYNINVAGNWNNTNGVFIPRNGEVIFDGAAANQYLYSTLNNPFWDLTINKTAGSVILQSAVAYNIQNNLRIISGTFNANTRSVTIGNNFLATGGGFSRSGTYILNKASGSATIQTNNSTLLNLTINGGATFNLADNLRVDGNFTLQSGTFNGNGLRVVLGYNANTIDIAGNYTAGPGGSLEIGYGCSLTVTPAGAIDLAGTSDNVVMVTRNINSWTGNYRFNCAGIIRARYTIFEWMGGQSNGINITGTIDPANNFSYCTFTNGSNTGAMLTIENTQTLTGANAIIDASFPTNPGGSAKNVRKTSTSSGIVEFNNASGVFAGENRDDDSPLGLIIWTGPITLTWTGTVSTDWYDPANWSASSGPDIVPTGSENVIIATGVNQPIITNSGALTDHLTIQNLATLTIYSTLNGGANDLQVNGDLIINGTLRLNSTTDFIAVKGNWTRNASGNTILNGSVTFNGTGSSKIINNGTSSFYDLTIDGTTLYSITTGSIIRNNVTINSGSALELSNNPYLLTVGGNWVNLGSFNPQTGRIIFNSSSGTKNINCGSTPFYDVDINAGSSYQLTGDFYLNRNFNISGNLILNGYDCYMGDGSGSDYLNVNGSLSINANSTLLMGASSFLQVNNGGTLNIIGSDTDNPASITRRSIGSYAFEINSGGTLNARYYTIDYTNTNGLYFRSGAILGSSDNLSEGIFANGASGGTYLKFENDFGGDITITNVVFRTGPQYNVIRLSGTDQIVFQDATGTMGNYSFESDITGTPDPNTGLILWTFLNTYIWTGSVDADWHTGGNWLTGLVPDLTKYVIIPDVTNDPVISANIAEARKITLYTGATFGITNQNLIIAEDIITSGTITVTGSPVITIGGNWNGASGIFAAGNSRVVFNASTGNISLATGTGNFYDLEINTAAGVVSQFAAAPVISRNLTVTSGTLNGTNVNITVGGSWNVTGVFQPGTRTVTLNGSSGTYSIDNGSNNFYNLTVNSGNGSGNATFLTNRNITINNSFTLTRGTFDLSPDGGITSRNLNVGYRLTINGGNLLARASQISVNDNWVVTSPGLFTCGTSTVLLTSPSGSRSLTPGSSAFYNLTINTGGSYRISNNTIINNNLNILNGSFDASSSPSYDITVSGNWTNNGTYIPRAGTVSFNGVNQSIAGSSAESFYNLVLTNNSILTLSNKNISISNGLTLTSGRIITGNYRIILGSGTSNIGTLSRTSGYVQGTIERWVNATGVDYLFPVGTAANYHPAILRFVSGLTSGSVIGRFVNSDPGNTGLPLNESGIDITSQFTDGYWDFTANNSFNCTNYNLNLTATGFSSYIINSESRILKRNNGGSWILDGSHSAPSGVVCYRNGMNNLSNLGTQFAIGNMECIGGQIAASQTICGGNDVAPFTNTQIAVGGNNNFTYTWQYTTNAAATPGDGNWTDVPASNSTIWDYGTLNQTTYFVRRAIATGCTATKYSNILTITVHYLPTTGPIFRMPNL